MGLHAAVVLPADCAVHVEGQRLESEDRGYRETKTYGSDKGKSETANTDRGVHIGTPDAADACSV